MDTRTGDYGKESSGSEMERRENAISVNLLYNGRSKTLTQCRNCSLNIITVTSARRGRRGPLLYNAIHIHFGVASSPPGPPPVELRALKKRSVSTLLYLHLI